MDTGTLFVLLSIIVLDVAASIKVMDSKTFDAQAKRLHLILIWLIPYIWAIIVLVHSDDPPKKTGKYEKHRYMETGYPNG